MVENQSGKKIWRLAADSTAGRLSPCETSKDVVVEEDASPKKARDNIVRDLMRIFDGLMGCTSKRSGMNLAFLHAHKSRPSNGTQRKLEQEIYRLIKGLVEMDSPNTGFAVNVLVNNCLYYFNKAKVPLSFGIFLTSLVEYLDGNDCLAIYPDEMVKLRMILNRG